MDGAWLPSDNISRNEAYTSAGLKMPTHELAQATEPGAHSTASKRPMKAEPPFLMVGLNLEIMVMSLEQSIEW
jgi:uncharacterized protein GlcG (DUF336 family)